MIAFVKGVLIAKTADSPRGAFFLVDLNGMGLEIFSSQRSVQSCGVAVEEGIQLYTALIVREDAMQLVGFNTKEERDLFNILHSASGVGLKSALALLSALSVSEIAQAVVSDQHQPLTRAKGVGPKLAQKITLELKEKMMSWRTTTIGLGTEEAGAPAGEAFSEAEAVLLSLGYGHEEITKSFKALKDDTIADSSEEILRESLRWLAHSL